MPNLENLQSKRILHSISEIEFDSLSLLYLSGNSIESVEIFHRMRMPKIREISIGNDYRAVRLNYVTGLSQLRKICFPQFNGINIGTS